MSIKKNNNINGWEDKKAVEEFVFMAEISAHYIKEYLSLEEITPNALALLDDKLETQIDKFYLDYSQFFYKRHKSIFYDNICLDDETITKIRKNSSIEYITGSIEYSNIEYGITKKHWIKNYNIIVAEFGATVSQSFYNQRINSFSSFLCDDKNIYQLFAVAKDCIKK